MPARLQVKILTVLQEAGDGTLKPVHCLRRSETEVRLAIGNGWEMSFHRESRRIAEITLRDQVRFDAAYLSKNLPTVSEYRASGKLGEFFDRGD